MVPLVLSIDWFESSNLLTFGKDRLLRMALFLHGSFWVLVQLANRFSSFWSIRNSDFERFAIGFTTSVSGSSMFESPNLNIRMWTSKSEAHSPIGKFKSINWTSLQKISRLNRRRRRPNSGCYLKRCSLERSLKELTASASGRKSETERWQERNTMVGRKKHHGICRLQVTAECVIEKRDWPVRRWNGCNSHTQSQSMVSCMVAWNSQVQDCIQYHTKKSDYSFGRLTSSWPAVDQTDVIEYPHESRCISMNSFNWIRSEKLHSGVLRSLRSGQSGQRAMSTPDSIRLIAGQTIIVTLIQGIIPSRNNSEHSECSTLKTVETTEFKPLMFRPVLSPNLLFNNLSLTSDDLYWWISVYEFHWTLWQRASIFTKFLRKHLMLPPSSSTGYRL